MRGLRRRTGSGTRWRRCFGDPSFPPGSPHSRPPEILDLGRGRLCVSATGETYPAWISELAPVQLLGQPRLFNVVFRIIQADFSRFALEGLEKLGASESRQQHSHRAPPPAERERETEKSLIVARTHHQDSFPLHLPGWKTPATLQGNRSSGHTGFLDLLSG